MRINEITTIEYHVFSNRFSIKQYEDSINVSYEDAKLIMKFIGKHLQEGE